MYINIPSRKDVFSHSKFVSFMRRRKKSDEEEERSEKKTISASSRIFHFKGLRFVVDFFPSSTTEAIFV